MKALTLTQPWASLMALRQKTVETRSWYTAYRGLLVIHAAKGFPVWARETCTEPEFAAALGGRLASDLPLSRGLCVVRLHACVSTEGFIPPVEEEVFGDYSMGRWAWITEYVKPLEDPPPVRGALGLWDWPHPDELSR